jgi:adenylate cyclase class 2
MRSLFVWYSNCMETEIEAKWLKIDVNEFRERLIRAEAELKQPERLMTRKVYDFADKRLEKIGGWVRVRNEGDKITLSYKQLNDRSMHGTQEVTVVVGDFENTCIFLESIGLVLTSFQETKRESWQLNGAEIEIDTWPWIPSFVEIEAKAESGLRQAAEQLGLDMSLALHGSVETAYQDAYDVSEEEIDNWSEIKFSPVPDWLAEKAKL